MCKPMTDERLETIDLRVELAAPGPWNHTPARITSTIFIQDCDGRWIATTDDSAKARASLGFIVDSPTMVKELLAEVRRLRAEAIYEPLVCGHPVGCETDTEKGIPYCEWCLEVGFLKSEAIEWHPWPGDDPEQDGEYHTTLICHGKRQLGKACWENGNWARFASFIVAWAELPAPYEGE